MNELDDNARIYFKIPIHRAEIQSFKDCGTVLFKDTSKFKYHGWQIISWYGGEYYL